MKLRPNIDMHRPLPLWVPLSMIAFAAGGMVWLTWRLVHAL